MSVFVVLLRAIGPVTHKIMSMTQWREAVAAAGFEAPETYFATGNMVVSGSGTAEAVTDKMNQIVQELGLGAGNRAVVRTSDQIEALYQANPLPEASAERPSEVAAYFFAEAKPDFGWIRDYPGPERISICREHLVVDYGGRGAGSRLPAIIERKSGVVTARNWNTLRGLVARIAARTA